MKRRKIVAVALLFALLLPMVLNVALSDAENPTVETIPVEVPAPDAGTTPEETPPQTEDPGTQAPTEEPQITVEPSPAPTESESTTESPAPADETEAPAEGGDGQTDAPEGSTPQPTEEGEATLMAPVLDFVEALEGDAVVGMPFFVVVNYSEDLTGTVHFTVNNEIREPYVEPVPEGEEPPEPTPGVAKVEILAEEPGDITVAVIYTPSAEEETQYLPAEETRVVTVTETLPAADSDNEAETTDENETSDDEDDVLEPLPQVMTFSMLPPAVLAGVYDEADMERVDPRRDIQITLESSFIPEKDKHGQQCHRVVVTLVEKNGRAIDTNKYLIIYENDMMSKIVRPTKGSNDYTATYTFYVYTENLDRKIAVTFPTCSLGDGRAEITINAQKVEPVVTIAKDPDALKFKFTLTTIDGRDTAPPPGGVATFAELTLYTKGGDVITDPPIQLPVGTGFTITGNSGNNEYDYSAYYGVGYNTNRDLWAYKADIKIVEQSWIASSHVAHWQAFQAKAKISVPVITMVPGGGVPQFYTVVEGWNIYAPKPAHLNVWYTTKADPTTRIENFTYTSMPTTQVTAPVTTPLAPGEYVCYASFYDPYGNNIACGASDEFIIKADPTDPSNGSGWTPVPPGPGQTIINSSVDRRNVTISKVDTNGFVTVNLSGLDIVVPGYDAAPHRDSATGSGGCYYVSGTPGYWVHNTPPVSWNYTYGQKKVFSTVELTFNYGIGTGTVYTQKYKLTPPERIPNAGRQNTHNTACPNNHASTSQRYWLSTDFTEPVAVVPGVNGTSPLGNRLPTSWTFQLQSGANTPSTTTPVNLDWVTVELTGYVDVHVQEKDRYTTRTTTHYESNRAKWKMDAPEVGAVIFQDVDKFRFEVHSLSGNDNIAGMAFTFGAGSCQYNKINIPMSGDKNASGQEIWYAPGADKTVFEFIDLPAGEHLYSATYYREPGQNHRESNQTGYLRVAEVPTVLTLEKNIATDTLIATVSINNLKTLDGVQVPRRGKIYFTDIKTGKDYPVDFDKTTGVAEFKIPPGVFDIRVQYKSLGIDECPGPYTPSNDIFWNRYLEVHMTCVPTGNPYEYEANAIVKNYRESIDGERIQTLPPKGGITYYLNNANAMSNSFKLEPGGLGGMDLNEAQWNDMVYYGTVESFIFYAPDNVNTIVARYDGDDFSDTSSLPVIIHGPWVNTGAMEMREGEFAAAAAAPTGEKTAETVPGSTAIRLRPAIPGAEQALRADRVYVRDGNGKIAFFYDLAKVPHTESLAADGTGKTEVTLRMDQEQNLYCYTFSLKTLKEYADQYGNGNFRIVTPKFEIRMPFVSPQQIEGLYQYILENGLDADTLTFTLEVEHLAGDPTHWGDPYRVTLMLSDSHGSEIPVVLQGPFTAPTVMQFTASDRTKAESYNEDTREAIPLDWYYDNGILTMSIVENGIVTLTGDR